MLHNHAFGGTLTRRAEDDLPHKKDREILVAAIGRADDAFKKIHPTPSLLSSTPKGILDDLALAIDRCEVYQAVAGHILFNGSSAPIITSSLLAPRVFDKRNHWDGAKWVEDLQFAADWLIQLLTTQKAEAHLRVAIWGFSVKEEVKISDEMRVLPFNALPDTFNRSRILDRAKDHAGQDLWLSPTHYGVPGAAFELAIPDVSFISEYGYCFGQVYDRQMIAKEFWSFIQAATTGHPLALCTWVDYENRELEFSEWEKWPEWILPEIMPRIHAAVPIDAQKIKQDWEAYSKLPGDTRSSLARSIDRFVLSKCRHQFVDRVLDLALAFEIAVGGGRGDNAPASWKVAVRSSQMIGGALGVRQALRGKLNHMYALRSRATHGGSMDSKDRADLEETVNECSQIYVALIQSFLALGAKPDWQKFELEPRTDY
jgi:hypothetical protein